MKSPTDLDTLCVNTIRTLSMDAVQQANSGHPGTAMAMAPVTYCLWQRVLRFDPSDPIWPNRDRFVLSIGHASMLLYSMLHLCGVKAVNPKYETLGRTSVTLDDIKAFRQLDSKCPGHPEYRWTSGVETTTGPLGQGVATSVGMALASRWMGQYFNRPGFDMVGFNVYALCGDGCMMEGVTGEAASLAGHLKVDNLCWIYDNNKITIEGHTEWAFSEDVATRFIGYGWNVTRVGDANDLTMLERAFHTFQHTSDRPTLIIVDSHIAYGSPHKQDTHAAHGEPLGEEEIRLTKRHYHWPEEAKFLIPSEVPQHLQAGMGARGGEARAAWMRVFGAYQKEYPQLADHLQRMQKRELPDGWEESLPKFPADPKGLAGRDASGTVLNAIAQQVPWLLGGSSDLAPSTKTRLTFDGAGDFTAKDLSGRNFHFGVREHAMGSILNGLSLTKVRPYGSGFLIFSDYMRPAIRLSAIMEIPVSFIFTHDSIGVGEDGPTHQPIEQLASLRAIPGLITLRPGDANEVVEAWRVMGRSILNGLSLTKVRPYGSGFLIFSDYMRPAIRLSAIMEIPVSFIFTHDSIGVGEDGPTHQPIEQLASLRAIPGLITLRPGDANEVVEAWRVMMQRHHEPVALVLSRQALPTLDRTKYASAAGVANGAYILADPPDGNPEVLLLATGSEVAMCVEAFEQLATEGVRARVVSMPSWELFEQQELEYRNRVIPPEVTARVSVEQASTIAWSRYVGLTGTSIGMNTFGASAPLKALQQKFGFTPGHLLAAVKDQLAKSKRSR